MTRFIALLSLALFSLLLAGCQGEETPVETENSVETVETSIDTPSESTSFTYENATYGFSLEMPEGWENVVVAERELDWGTNGTTPSLDFGLTEGESLFNIAIFTPDQWAAISAEGGPLPTYLDETTDYVFAGTGSQDADPDHQDEREQVDAILASFSWME